MTSLIARRTLLAGAAGALAVPPFASARAGTSTQPLTSKETDMTATTPFTKMPAPAWLLAFWKEIDDKTWGAGFDCFADDAVCHLGVADWHGRERSAPTCASSSTSR